MPRRCQALHKLGKPQKIRDPNQRASLPDDYLRIGGDQVRPLPWNRAHAILIDAQQEPSAIPVVSLADAHKLLSAEWVKWVRHTHKKRRCIGKTCILS